MINTCLSGGRIRRNQILVRISIGGNGCSFKADFIQHFTNAFEIIGAPLENRNFHTVKAGRLDIGQQRAVFRANAGGPKKHAHSDFHRSPFHPFVPT